jgi:hypothetical protein
MPKQALFVVLCKSGVKSRSSSDTRRVQVACDVMWVLSLMQWKFVWCIEFWLLFRDQLVWVNCGVRILWELAHDSAVAIEFWIWIKVGRPWQKDFLVDVVINEMAVWQLISKRHIFVKYTLKLIVLGRRARKIRVCEVIKNDPVLYRRSRCILRLAHVSVIRNRAAVIIFINRDVSVKSIKKIRSFVQLFLYKLFHNCYTVFWENVFILVDLTDWLKWFFKYISLKIASACLLICENHDADSLLNSWTPHAHVGASISPAHHAESVPFIVFVASSICVSTFPLEKPDAVLLVCNVLPFVRVALIVRCLWLSTPFAMTML